MNDGNDTKHGAIILKDNFHKWAEDALKVKKLSKRDRENILLARDSFEMSFYDVLEFTSVEPTGRLGEIITQLMLYSAALGQLSPKAEIQKLILKNAEGIEKNSTLHSFRKTKAIPKTEALEEVVKKYLPEIQASRGVLTKTIHLNIWLATHTKLKTPDQTIKENKKKKKLPWPNWQNVRDAIDSALENDCDQSN